MDVFRVLGRTKVDNMRRYRREVDLHSVARKRAEMWQIRDAEMRSENARKRKIGK